jgi:DNA-binding GntR family transcriptional regulator
MQRLVDEGAAEPEVIAVHTDFHLALHRDCNNSLFLSLIRIFATIQSNLTLVERYRTRDMRAFILVHRALLDAVEAGDRAAVRARLIEHFEEPLQWSGATNGSQDPRA